MEETLFTVLKYVVGVLAIVVFRYFIPFVSLKLKDAKYAGLVDFVQTCINAAESVYKFIEKSGDQKKVYVVDRIKEYVKEHKINISDAQIDVLIQGIFTELDGLTINKAE
jgi:hypothetical protein